MTTGTVLEISASDLGTLEFDQDTWVPYLDLAEELSFIPTQVRAGIDDYVYHSSTPVFGNGAELPKRVRELRSAGKKVLVIERGATGSGGKNERYYLFVSPP
jgi:hypothetical protein